MFWFLTPSLFFIYTLCARSYGYGVWYVLLADSLSQNELTSGKVRYGKRIPHEWGIQWRTGRNKTKKVGLTMSAPTFATPIDFSNKAHSRKQTRMETEENEKLILQFHKWIMWKKNSFSLVEHDIELETFTTSQNTIILFSFATQPLLLFTMLERSLSIGSACYCIQLALSLPLSLHIVIIIIILGRL